MKKYIIAITLFCISLILIDDAYALTGDYASSNFQIFTYDSPEGGTRTSSGYSSGLNVSHYLNGGYLDGLYIQVFGNDEIVYEAGNTYTFVFKVNFNSKNWKYLDNTFTTSNLKVSGSKTSSPTDMSTENITSSSLSIANVDGDTYQMIYTFKVVPEVNLKYLLFQCFYPYGLLGADLNYVYNLLTVRVVDLAVTYEQGVGAIVDQQTTVIQNSTNQILNSQQQTNDKLDETNKELGEVKDEIKNQFENCRDSYNLLNYSLSSLQSMNKAGTWNGNTYTFNDVSYTVNDDLTILVNGTASSSSYFIISNDLTSLKQGTQYKLNGSPSGGNYNTYAIRLYVGSSYSNQIGNDLSFVYGEQNLVRINIFGGAEADNLIFKPMIRLASVASSIYEKPGEKVCINRIDETNDKLDNLNDSLTNDNTSGANDSASSFFDSFTSEDNGGISSIITAPLNLINGMLDVNTLTCKPLSVNILGKDVDLPCGKLLWSRAPNSIVVLWQTIICGFFSYKLIVSLYHDIDKLKDPEQKGVDTLDL